MIYYIHKKLMCFSQKEFLTLLLLKILLVMT